MKLSVLKMNITQITMSLVLGFVVAFLFAQTAVFASLTESARGFAWGGMPSADGAYQGMGWISLNNLSDGSGTSYGVHIPFGNGNLSGYAWSTHYGWISFNGADLAGCSPALGQATRSGNAISGGARIIAIRDAGGNAGGFDGCISLSGTGYGLTIGGSASPYTLSGYAWSSDLGWINFSGATVEYNPTASVAITGCTIPMGSNSCSGSLTWNIVDAESPNVFNQTNGTQYSTSPSGTNVPVTLVYGTNNIVARNGSSVIQSTNTTIACAGIGAWDSVSGLCVDPRPNLTQPNISHVPSAAFDPATGAYSYVDVTFQTQNDGRSSTGVTSAYVVQLDRNNDGSYDSTNSGTLPTLASGAYSTPTTQRFNNVSFGAIRLRVAVDTGNAITEVNEADNERVLANITLPPPDPGLEIISDRYQVRNGETVVISWDTNVTYPMQCSIFGPGITTVNFDPSVAGATGTQVTGPIGAKSEFTITCREPITDTTFTKKISVETQGTIEEI